MTLPDLRTNGDMIAPYTDELAARARRGLDLVRDHPDEVAAAAAPFVVLTLATMRHRLNLTERLLLSQCAVWGGLLAMDRYRDWKNQLRED